MGARTWIGIAYGLVLGSVAFMCTGAGHGTYIPAAVSSAPLGLLGIAGGLLGAPALWAGIGALLEPQRRRGMAVLGIMLLHYGSAAWLLTHEPFGDWEYFARFATFAPGIVIFWTLVYLAGQSWAWYCLVDALANKRLQPTARLSSS